MEKELIILVQIKKNPHVSQRDLALIAQASLGMINAILKKFVVKGLISIKKVNNRNTRYVLTPDGIDEISRRSWGYFKRTIKNILDYQEIIREVINRAISEGFQGVLLVGKSDFDFIIEHLCYKLDISYKFSENQDNLGCWFSLISEKYDIITSDQEDKDYFLLRHLVIR